MSCKCTSCSKTFNPYSQMGTDHIKLLNYIVSRLPDHDVFDSSSSSSMELPDSCVSVDLLVGITGVTAASWEKVIGPVSEDSTINSRLTNPFADIVATFPAQVLQHYWDSTGMDNFNAMQRKIIDQLLYKINDIPPESIGCFLANAERIVANTTMTNAEKNPIYRATAIGKASADYWNEKVEVPEKWSVFLNSNYTVRRAKIPFQVCAAMKGTLIASSKVESLPQVYPLDQSINVVAIQLAGATTGTASVVLGMLPRAKGMNGETYSEIAPVRTGSSPTSSRRAATP